MSVKRRENVEYDTDNERYKGKRMQETNWGGAKRYLRKENGSKEKGGERGRSSVLSDRVNGEETGAMSVKRGKSHSNKSGIIRRSAERGISHSSWEAEESARTLKKLLTRELRG